MRSVAREIPISVRFTVSWVPKAIPRRGVVFGVERPPPGSTNMPEITRRYLGQLQRHREDRIIDQTR